MLAPPSSLRVPATPVVESADIRSLYDVDNAILLGKGGFSQVVAVRHKPTNTTRALKVMRRDKLQGKIGEMVLHEREILRRTSHPNIITLHESITTPHHVYFALDLMGGDLFEFIVRNKRIPEDVARSVMHQLLLAIHYLHEQCIVHRDIKPENILLNITTTNTNTNKNTHHHHNNHNNNHTTNHNNTTNTMPEIKVEVKLADFGLAKLVQDANVQSTPCGTSFYIAPEVIRGIEANGAKPLCTTQERVKSVDVWSAGVVLFVMLAGRPPFHGQVKTSEERRQLLQSMDHGVLFSSRHGWDLISAEAKDLIVRMLEQNTLMRLTAMQALQHPFFTQYGLTPPIMPLLNRVSTKQQQQQEKGKESSHGLIIDENDNDNNEASSTTITEQVVEKKRKSFWNIFGGRHNRQNGKNNKDKDNKDKDKSRSSINSNSNSNNKDKESNNGDNNGKSGSENADDTTQSTTTNNTKTNTAGEEENKQKNKTNTNNNNNIDDEDEDYDDDEDEEDEEENEKRVAEQMRKMQAEINAIQQDIIATGDKEGDHTTYTHHNIIIREAPAVNRPAVMNAKAKIGPSALRKP